MSKLPARFKKAQPETFIIDCTPELAATLMEHNTANRTPIKGNTTHLTNIIENGEWRVNGESIKISNKGNILDGQHRLDAIIKSGETCRLVIVVGLDEEVFDTIDQGSPRSLGTLLQIQGVDYPKKAAAILQAVLPYEEGRGPRRIGGHKQYSKHVLLQKYNERAEDIDRAAAFVADNKILCRLLAPSYLGAAYYTFYALNADDTKTFFSALGGNATMRVQPADALRDRLLLDQMDTTHKIPLYTKLAFVFQAWNAYRNGEELAPNIRWHTTGKGKETFPRAV